MSLNPTQDQTQWCLRFHKILKFIFIFLSFQVHTFYRSCGSMVNGDATCNCAVAIRIDDDVVLFDRCGPITANKDTFPFTVKLFRNGDLEVGTRVMRMAEGSKYQVLLWWCFTLWVTDCWVVRAGVSVTWSVLSWSGGHEFEPRSGPTWGM